MKVVIFLILVWLYFVALGVFFGLAILACAYWVAKRIFVRTPPPARRR